MTTTRDELISALVIALFVVAVALYLIGATNHIVHPPGDITPMTAAPAVPFKEHP